MNRLERRLSEGLEALAGAAPHACGELRDVKRAGRRRLLVRRIVLTAGVAAFGAAALGSVVLLNSLRAAPDVAAPSTQETTAPAVLAPDVSTTVASTVPDTTLPPTSTTAPSVQVPVELQMSWERIDGQATLENSWLATVAEGGPGLVAGGYVKDGTRNDWSLNATIWVSTNGFEWERIDDPTVFGTSGDALISDVLATDEGFVALGFEGSRRVIWTSSNGYEWARTSIEEWPYQTISGPTSGSRYWLSIDGVEWYESQPPGSGDLSVYDIVSGGPGFVAVGGEVVSYDPFQRRSVIWISPDGTEWERLPDEEVGSYDVFTEVAVDSSGSPILAFGSSTLISDDGLVWREVEVSGPMPVESRNRVVWTDRGVVVAGLTFRGDSAEVWVSDDGGATLYAVESPAFRGNEADISDVAAFGGSVVAVGGDRGNWIGWHWGPTPITEPGRDAAVWIGTWTNG